MSSMQLLFTALACFVSAPLFPADNANTTNATISCEARMLFRPDYERTAYKPIQSCSPVIAADSASLVKYYEAYRNSLSDRGYYARDSNQHYGYEGIVYSDLLPANFRDDFSTPWFGWDRSVEYFKNQFHKKLHKIGLHNQHDKALPYERAEMRRWWLYESCEFRDFLKDLCVYQDYMLEIAAELARDKKFAEAVTQACSEDSVHWIRDEASRVRCDRRQKEVQQQFRQDVHTAFTRQPAWVDDDTRIFYEDYERSDSSRFIKRAQAEAEIKRGGFRFTQQSYTLSKEAAALLREFDIRGPYHTCYGNQLQQVIHQECVELIERTAQLKPESPIFEHQESLVYCIEAAHTYNKVGRTHNASVVADFCYALLDYGKAVLEGARDGLLSVAQQAINDPLQTVAAATLSVAVGEYLLAYQLGKIAYGVLNLTVNAVIDPEQAQKTWDGYITPISSLIDALQNKQISLRDGIRAGTALAVSMKAQSMLAKGCGKLYSVAKTRALEYIAKNPLANPEQYMVTTDGLMFKASHENALLCSMESQPSVIRSMEQGSVYKVVCDTGEKCRIVGPLDEYKSWDWAEAEYKLIRTLSDDVEKISKHINKAKFYVARIKKHLFFDCAHKLDSRVGKLDADPEIARAWNRLYAGDFIKNDLKLLEHEYFESKFELLYKTGLRKAHEAAQSLKGRPWFPPVYEE